MNIHQVLSLPGTLQADSIYFVLNGSYAESYITNDAGEAKLIGNSTMITALAGGGGSVEFHIVADITARDALTLTANSLVLAVDASSDADVASGAAMYAWNQGTTSFSKVTEFESFNENVVLDWANLQNKPASSVALIDDAVGKRHTHANQTLLDGFGGTASAPTIDGDPIARLTTDDW